MKKMICRLRNHNWEEWRNQNDKSCLVQRSCSRCKKTEERTVHNYNDKSQDKCFVDKECIRCGHKVSYKNHNWEAVEDELYSDDMLASYSDTLYTTTIPDPEIVCTVCGEKQRN